MLKERGNLASSRNRTLLIINKQWSVMLQEGLQLGLGSQLMCFVSWGLGGDGVEERKSRPQLKW